LSKVQAKTGKKHSQEEILNDAELLKILIGVKSGNFSVQLPGGQPGTKGAIYDVLNEIIDLNKKMSGEFEKAAEANGKKASINVFLNLEEKAILLAEQKRELDIKNLEVEEAKRSLEEQSNQLTLTSKYKSEFLANMSHELRTPLNSLQILAHELIENHEGNLTPKQIQFAKTINACGEELIELINDILDLSKIESGYISINSAPLGFEEIKNYIENTFKQTAEIKNLRLNIIAEEGLPEFIDTDSQRLNQILKNLLSNSFKFTEKGQVQLKIYKAGNNSKVNPENADKSEPIIAFEVSDTGIGISEDKQNIIFEAFQQAEGSTSRKYGGTGLGLSISRGLASLLGGTIELESMSGQGSKFTLFLPLIIPNSIKNKQIELKDQVRKKSVTTHAPVSVIQLPEKEEDFVEKVKDDRLNIVPKDKVLLIIDNDVVFAKVILEKAHANGLKLVATTKGNDMIELLNQFHPFAIIKNINLLDVNGWKVLDRLKNDLTWRHIPIYVTSVEKDKNIALKCGARNFLVKPIQGEKLNELFNDIIDFTNKKTKSLLIIDNNEDELESIIKSVEYDDVVITAAKTANEAIDLISANSFDCIVLNVTASDKDRSAIIAKLEEEKLKKENSLIVYSAKDIGNKERALLNLLANCVIIKSKNSLDQLVDQISLFLHRTFNDLPDEMRGRIENFTRSEDVLPGKKVLVVDDDIRNLFALTTALERFGLNIISVESGQEAINMLNKTEDIDMILMDIMMPEMDGYETMQRIRISEVNRDVPIIAVTAKAMKGDRQKCIESGASDYITKPVNIDQLVFLMRIWLKQYYCQ